MSVTYYDHYRGLCQLLIMTIIEAYVSYKKQTSLKEHIDNVKNNYIQRGQDIKFNINLAKFSIVSNYGNK